MSESNASPVEQPGGKRYRAIASKRYGGALDVPAFRWLWLLSLFSSAGDAIATIAMPLLVYDLTGSAGLLGAMFVLQQIPRVLLSPAAGVVADRIDRRQILVWSAIIRAILATLIPLMGDIWQIAVLAMLISTATALSRPAELATLPAILEGSAFLQGLSLIQVTNNVMRIIGPAAGAAIISVSSPSFAFILQALCLAASAAAAWRLVLPKLERTTAWTGWKTGLQSGWGDLAEGVRVVWRTPIVRGIVAAESLWCLVSAALVVTAVVLTEDTLDLGSRSDAVFGALTATFAGGAVLGALLARTIEQRTGRGTMLAVGYCGPLFLIPMIVTPPLPVIFVIWFAFGVADSLAVVALQSYLAEAVPDKLRGRVYATWITSVTIASIIAFSLAGWITPILGAPVTFFVVGVVTGIGAPFLLWVTGALAAVRHKHAPGVG
jgi:MFS family permease